MIAFIRPPEEPPRLTAAEKARRFLARTLLPQPSEESGEADDVRTVAAWKAWLFAGGLVVVALWCCFRVVVGMF